MPRFQAITEHIFGRDQSQPDGLVDPNLKGQPRVGKTAGAQASPGMRCADGWVTLQRPNAAESRDVDSIASSQLTASTGACGDDGTWSATGCGFEQEIVEVPPFQPEQSSMPLAMGEVVKSLRKNGSDFLGC